MAPACISPADLRAQFPVGTVLHNPVTGEYARVLEHTAERAVGELLAVDMWNGGGNLRARVTVTPPGGFAAMIAAVWGLAVVGRTNAKGVPGPVDAALLVEAFGDEIVFERPPRLVQQALAVTVGPIARRRAYGCRDAASTVHLRSCARRSLRLSAGRQKVSGARTPSRNSRAGDDPPEGPRSSLCDHPPGWDPHRFGSPAAGALGGIVRGACP